MEWNHIPLLLRRVVFVSLLVVFNSSIVGCQSAEPQTPSVTPTSSTTLSNALIASAIYTNTEYGYSVRYPASFYDLLNYGAPDSDKYFASEDVRAPLEMESGGLWITIRVSENANQDSLSEWAAMHPNSPLAQISNARQLVVDGESAIQQVQDSTSAEGTEGAYAVVTYVSKNDQIYSITALAFSKEAFMKHQEEYDLIVSSFKFLD